MEFKTEINVRYSETDQMGIVYHANYLSWFDVARCNLLEEIGFPYHEIEEQGFQCPVLHVDIDYRIPFKFGDRAVIYTKIVKNSPVRTTYAYRLFLKGEDPETVKPRIVGTSTHCMVNSQTFKPVIIKKVMPDLYNTYESILS